MATNNFSQLASFIWSVADLLRGDFRQSQYGRIILPFTVLRRLECVLEESKPAVLAEHQRIQSLNLSEDAQEMFLLRATKTEKNKDGLSFFNTSPMNLKKMGQNDIKLNLETYVQSFSKDAREIFAYFNFNEFVGLLDDANLLYKVVEKFSNAPLSPDEISNHDMGKVFEELIRRFAESSNDTAGEHFTPRDIVDLTTSLVFMNDDDALSKDGIIRTIYDPTAGTGGFLSSGMEYVLGLNPKVVMRAFGQELNPESYAICKADMLIKGQDVSRIKLGNTLSNDQLEDQKFDYMLSNPPFGVDWKKIEQDIKDEHTLKGFEGRFGPGLPRVSDGSLLFLMHLISKMRNRDEVQEQGSRIGIILNGSPLFTGSAGSGESEIRRYILETDLLEAIIALPTDMFYNTGIATYVWVLSNKKDAERKGKVHLINATNLSSKMRKSLGSKRNYLTDEEIRIITQNYGAFEAVDTLAQDSESDQQKPFSSKIFNIHEFGYRRVTIERPLRLSAQMSNDRINRLKFSSKFLDVIMETLFVKFGEAWNDESYGDFSDVEVEARAFIKANYPDIKEKDVKTLLSKDLWVGQKSLFMKAKMLQGEIGLNQFDDINDFSLALKSAIKRLGISLDSKEQKLLLNVVSWKNPEAQPVIKRVLKVIANPLYGHFEYKDQVVEFEQDGDLRDAENIALDPSQSTTDLIVSYFNREVQPHVPDAWINSEKLDAQDGEIGVVGYEIPFNRHFYVYEPPRDLSEIDADLDAVSREIMVLLQEVHS